MTIAVCDISANLMIVQGANLVGGPAIAVAVQENPHSAWAGFGSIEAWIILSGVGVCVI
jgi:hypothetical protein